MPKKPIRPKPRKAKKSKMESTCSRRGKPRVHPTQIMNRHRFDPKGGEKLTDLEIQFARAMHNYLAGKLIWMPGQVLDVIWNLGYRNHERDWVKCVNQFTAAINTLRRGSSKKRRRLFPTWAEVLAEAKKLGWYLPAPPKLKLAPECSIL